MKTQQMVKAFQVFKNGRTENWVTILIPENEYNSKSIEKKINFYLSLGYLIKHI